MSSPPERPLSNQGFDVDPGTAPERRTDRKAIAALVLGILGLLALPIIFSTLAIVFGRMSMKDIERNPALAGRGLAVAGFVLGIVGLVVGLVILAVILAAG